MQNKIKLHSPYDEYETIQPESIEIEIDETIQIDEEEIVKIPNQKTQFLTFKIIISLILFISGIKFYITWLMNYFLFKKSNNNVIQIISLLSLATFLGIGITCCFSILIGISAKIVFLATSSL